VTENDTHVTLHSEIFSCRLHAMNFVPVDILLYLTFQTQLTVLSTIQYIYSLTWHCYFDTVNHNSNSN